MSEDDLTIPAPIPGYRERREAKARIMAEWRKRNLAKGLCPTCGKIPSRPGGRQCQPCLDRKNASRAKRLLASPRIRRCPCGEPALPKHYRCEHCLVKRPAMGLKTCARCGLTKHRHSFPSDPNRVDGKFPDCKMCHRAYEAAWRAANPERAKERQDRANAKAKLWRQEHPEAYREIERRRMLLRRYGITPEQYGQKLDEQGGHCALCDRTPAMEKHGVLAVDHDHTCCGSRRACGNCFRFLLCFSHNTMLGLAKDDPAVLRAAADLLEESLRSRGVRVSELPDSRPTD